MSIIDEIKTAIDKLSDPELARLRDWLAELDAQRFDAQIERDAAAGKLDEMMAKARANHHAGLRREV